MTAAVAYLRVSSREQGKSGLGLEAQRAAIERFCQADGDLQVTDWYTEVESAKRVSDTLARRPQLAAALNRAAELGGPIVVAKLDRLSRDVHFVSGLMAHGVQFIACELGRQSDPFMLHIYAAFAEKERALIGQRTTAALQAAKKRGTRLGSPSPHIGSAVAAERRNAEAVAFAMFIRRHTGEGTWRDKAARLNELGIKTANGKRWNPGGLYRLLALPGRS